MSPWSARHDVAERDERGAIAGLQAVEHSLAGGLQVAEPQALQARAHVERQHHVQRNLLEAREIDALAHAIVQHLEIGRRQPLHRPAVLGHQHIDAHRLDSAGEGLLRRRRARGAKATIATDSAINGRRSRATTDPPAAVHHQAAPR